MSLKKERFIKGIILAPDTIALDGIEGEIKVDSATGKIQATLKDGVNPSAAREIITSSQTQTLTNKTIDASLNTVSNISDTSLSASASISRSKVASGTADHVVINSGTGALSSEATLAASRGGLGTSGAAFTGVVKASSGTFSASTVVDSDISATAAVARTKLASGTANRVVVNDGTGVISDAAAITASCALASDANGIPVASATTASELGFVSGVTSAIQTQFSGKENTITTLPVSKGGTNSSTALNNNRVVQSSGGAIVEAAAITAARALISDANGIPTHSTVTSTTLDFLDATSSVQTQINSKVNSSGGTLTSGSVVTPSRLDVKQDTLSNLTTYALTASNAQLCFATDTKQMFQVVDTALVSVGSSAGGFDSFINLDSSENLNTWSNGNNASYLGGGTLAGTFAKDSSTPLNGASSYLYTQAAGSLNDYLASPAQAVPVRFRGNSNTFTFSYLYNGNSTDIEPVVYDITNATKLNVTTNLLPSTGNNASIYKANISIPLTCLSIRVGFQVKVLNSGKILEFDDVQLSADTTKYTDPGMITDWQNSGTLSIGAVTTPPTKGTITRDVVNTRRVGDSLEIEIDYVQSTAGTAGSGDYLITLPAGLSINLNKVAASTTITSDSFANDRNRLGEGLFSTSDVTGISFFAYDTTRIYGKLSYSLAQSTGNAGNSFVSNSWSSAVSQTAFSNTGLAFKARITVPIAGWQATNPQIITAAESFSSDTASFVYANAATYTQSTLTNAPVGTYITFTYAASGNTRTQTTGANRPTQTDADMSLNGVRMYARAFDETTTSALPASVAIQIGKNFKGIDVSLFKSTGKATRGSIDYVLSGTVKQGLSFKNYDPTTGVLYLDSRYDRGTNSASAGTMFIFDDLVEQDDGYVVINASKSPALVGVPQVQPRIATLSDVKASGTGGGSFTSGSFITRTLNTISDNTGIVTSLASNQFTLPAGEYYIEASAPVYAIDRNKLKIRNITDGTDAILGQNAFGETGSASADRAVLLGQIIITSAKVFELQHRCNVSNGNGLGLATSFGVNEVYAQVKITRVR